jgi:hypothetical protein
MSARVSEDAVRSALTWARNYGEIESYEVVAKSGRRWKIVLSGPTPVSGSTDGITLLSGVVPGEIVLTSREALAFAYGCAVAGAKERRADFAARAWGWGVADAETDPPDEPRRELVHLETEDQCCGCAAALGSRHRPGCPYEHNGQGLVDHVQTRITPV